MITSRANPDFGKAKSLYEQVIVRLGRPYQISEGMIEAHLTPEEQAALTEWAGKRTHDTKRWCRNAMTTIILDIGYHRRGHKKSRCYELDDQRANIHGTAGSGKPALAVS